MVAYNRATQKILRKRLPSLNQLTLINDRKNIYNDNNTQQEENTI